MAEELGRIERPAAESFLQGRKLFVVPLLFRGEDSSPEYVEKFDLYWQQVSQHIANLEARLEPAKHVYHESISQVGDEGLRLLEALNPKSTATLVRLFTTSLSPRLKSTMGMSIRFP